MTNTTSNTKLKYHLPHWERILANPIISAVLLAIICFCLLHSALGGGWRFDDGPHLYFTALYSPWQYFFVPEIMREQSWANFTPWNAFFYEMGLPFFGLNPTGHYAHLLTVLWLTALSTYILLRLWLSATSSFFGAVIFLAMPTTGAIGQMLMTGHYAYGLLFSVLSITFFTRSIREKKLSLSFLSAVFYFLACWSKELYVPIIGLLILLPEGKWPNRLKYALPSLAVALVYTTYRLVVFEGVGGYGIQAQTGEFNFSNILYLFTSNLFGSLWVGSFIAIIMGASVIFALFIQKKNISIIFLLACLIVIFFPIFFMILSGDIGNALNIRLLFFIGWSISIMFAWFANGDSKAYWMVLTVVIGLLMYSQHYTMATLTHSEKSMEEENHFLINGAEDEILLPISFARTSYLSDIKNAAILIGKKIPPTFPADEEALVNLSVEKGANAYKFIESCQCVQQVGLDNYQRQVNNFRSSLDSGKSKSMSIFIEIKDLGFRKLLRWKFSGPEGRYYLYVRNYTVIPLPNAGEMNFAATGFLNQKKEIDIYVHLLTPDGAIIRSPLLSINPSKSNHTSWQGKSAVKWE